jgi:prepilin-type N-terminal cleavage/methylation domain-containing protein
MNQTRQAFSLLEVLLALAVVAMVLAAIGPALTGTLRAQRQAREILEPLAAEEAAFSQLREDLVTAPRPDGSLGVAFSLLNSQVDRWPSDELSFVSAGAPPLHPQVAIRSPEAGQAVVTWSGMTSLTAPTGFAWTRARQSNVLASSTVSDPVSEVLLDGLAQLTLSVFIDGEWVSTYNSDDRGAVLPVAVRVEWAYADENGNAGPLHVRVLDLPVVPLDPNQLLDGGV